MCSQIPIYNELTRDGEIGLMFQPGDAITLAGQLERLLGSAALRRELLRQGARRGSRLGRRSPTRSRRSTAGSAPAATTRAGNPELRRRIARRREIHVDLHMHTDHSSDCATPVETLLATAREAGLGRSRSPTTTRSRAPSPRGDRRATSGSR